MYALWLVIRDAATAGMSLAFVTHFLLEVLIDQIDSMPYTIFAPLNN